MFEETHFIDIAFDPAVPHNELPTLPPSIELEDKRILKTCIDARVALAELNQICLYFPFPELILRVFAWLEVVNSCALDEYNVDINEVLKLPRYYSPHESEFERAFAIQQTMIHGLELIKKRTLDISLLQELCSEIERSPMPVRRVSIQVKSRENVPVYTPPVGSELLQSLLGNWEKFVNVEAGDLDPLVLIAVAHYQFEAIQPFSSSNSALVRLVDYLLLQEEGLLSQPILNFSGWLYKNKNEYCNLQLDVTQQQRWLPWIDFILRGIAASAIETAAQLKTTETLINHTHDFIAQKLPRIYSPDLMQVLFSEPHVRIHNLVEQGIARRQTASVYLKQLCAIGVLAEVPYGKEKLFVHKKLLSVLTGPTRQYVKYQL